MKKKGITAMSVLLSVLLGATTFVGCGSKENGNGNGKAAANQALVYNLATEPKTIDPTLAEALDNANCIIQAFEGLTRHDDKGEIKKGVAEDWKISSDGLVYTFKLRKDAKWSDGKPVKAQDFEYAWKRVLNPKSVAPYNFFFTDYIKGAKEYYVAEGKTAGTGKWEDVGIKVKDDNTLEVTLKAPTIYFPQLLANPAMFPLRQDIVEKDPKNWTQDPKTYIGNGPFKMTAWKHKDAIEWVKNDNYWDAKNIKLSKMTFLMVEEESSAVASFDNGEMDYLYQVTATDIKRLKDEKKFRTSPQFATYYFNFNLNKKPFDNIKVRKALTLAINRKDLVEGVLKAGQKPGTAFVPFGYKESDGKTDYKSKGGDWYKPEGDIAEAKKLLAEAGYPDGKGFPSVTYSYNTNENHKKVAEFLQDQWKKNLGIEVKLQNMEWNVFQDARKAGNFDLARGGWVADYVDPTTFLDMMVKGNTFNDPKYDNPKYEQLLKDCKSEKDIAKRNKLMHDAEAMLKEDLPIVPLYFYVNEECYDEAKVKNAIATPVAFTYFDHAYVVDAGK